MGCDGRRRRNSLGTRRARDGLKRLRAGAVYLLLRRGDRR